MPAVDPVSGTHATSRDEWDQAFRRVSDYDALARSALNAALAGDGRAALTLGRILRRCVTTMRYVRAEARAGRVPVARPEGLVDAAMFDRCQRLGADDPFKRLPTGSIEYDLPSYWFREAARLRDPVGLSMGVVDDLEKAISEPPRAGAAPSVADIRHDMMDIVRANDPQALYILGLTLIDPRLSSDPIQGAAMILASCELGLDCSGNTQLIDSACEFIPSGCGTPITQQDLLARDMGPSLYAKAYARAQTIADLVRQQDWDGLHPITELNGSALRGK